MKQNAASTSISESLNNNAYRITCMILGTLLLCAAALKAEQLATTPSAADAIIGSWWGQLAAVNVEFALGLWLWSGAYPASARRVALLTFTGFAGLSLLYLVRGRASCGCFGAVEVAPWAMVVVDTLGVVACWAFRPSPAAAGVSSWRAVAAGGVMIAAGVPVNAKILQSMHAPPLVVSPERMDMGHVGRGGASSSVFELHNHSGEEVEIGSVETSCPCASVRPSRKTLSPNERLQMVLNLNMAAEPDFQGGLRVRVQGRSREGKVLFSTTADALVR